MKEASFMDKAIVDPLSVNNRRVQKIKYVYVYVYGVTLPMQEKKNQNHLPPKTHSSPPVVGTRGEREGIKSKISRKWESKKEMSRAYETLVFN